MPVEKTLSEKVSERLRGGAALAGLVAGRVHPFTGAYGGAFPAVYWEVGDLDTADFVTLGARWVGTQRARLTLHCMAKSYGAAERVRDAAEDALNGWFDTATEVEIHGCFADGGLDPHEFRGGSSEEVIYRCVREFRLHTHRSTP